MGLQTWREEQDWEQLLEEFADVPVRDEKLGRVTVLRDQESLARTSLSKSQGSQLHSSPPLCCMGWEEWEETRWWFIQCWCLTHTRGKCQEGQGLGAVLVIEFNMVLGGTCRMKRWIIFMEIERLGRGQADYSQQGQHDFGVRVILEGRRGPKWKSIHVFKEKSEIRGHQRFWEVVLQKSHQHGGWCPILTLEERRVKRSARVLGLPSSEKLCQEASREW